MTSIRPVEARDEEAVRRLWEACCWEMVPRTVRLLASPCLLGVSAAAAAGVQAALRLLGVRVSGFSVAAVASVCHAGLAIGLTAHVWRQVRMSIEAARAPGGELNGIYDYWHGRADRAFFVATITVDSREVICGCAGVRLGGVFPNEADNQLLACARKMGVDPSFRDLHVGHKLMMAVEQWARAHGARESIYLTPNPMVKSFLRTLGYSRASRRCPLRVPGSCCLKPAVMKKRL
eukprot:m.77923 g.77923  ORF g.77923 m.77923 type:complete len:234 (+) comp8149_c0_seq2:240-941(+)